MSTDDRDLRATSPIEVPEEDTMTMPLAGAAAPAEADNGPSRTSESPAGPATTATTAATATAAPAAMAPLPEPKRGIRVGTVVWGLVIAAVGAFILAYALGVTFDAEARFHHPARGGRGAAAGGLARDEPTASLTATGAQAGCRTHRRRAAPDRGGPPSVSCVQVRR